MWTVTQVASFVVSGGYSNAHTYIRTYTSIWSGQNNGNNEELRNRICVGYIDRTSGGNTECSTVCLLSVVLVSVH
jgi:hypothetical protein